MPTGFTDVTQTPTSVISHLYRFYSIKHSFFIFIFILLSERYSRKYLTLVQSFQCFAFSALAKFQLFSSYDFEVQRPFRALSHIMSLIFFDVSITNSASLRTTSLSVKM